MSLFSQMDYEVVLVKLEFSQMKLCERKLESERMFFCEEVGLSPNHREEK